MKFHPNITFKNEQARRFVEWCFKQEQIQNEEKRKAEYDAIHAKKQANVAKVLEQFSARDKEIRAQEQKTDFENKIRKNWQKIKGRKR